MVGTASYFNYEGDDGKVVKDIAWSVSFDITWVSNRC